MTRTEANPEENEGHRVTIEPGRQYVVYDESDSERYTVELTGVDEHRAYGMTVPGGRMVTLDSVRELVSAGRLLPADEAL